ncbi:MAG: HAMP domain-containing histidine kinase [Clostridiales bacterium]|nr:HAMP domain-containing histidine kinase [Clostridiales bacterium]
MNEEKTQIESEKPDGEKNVENKALDSVEKKEAVRETLREIKSENAPQNKKPRKPSEVLLLIVKILFFPITLTVLAVNRLFKRFKVGIAVKATVIFTVVFGIMIIGYAAFTLASISSRMKGGGGLTEEYMNQLIITSVILVFVFIVLGCVIGSLSSQYMINPVRKITKRIEEISEENLSARVDPVDSQDEVRELTDQINAMLESLQQAFERQENFVSDASHELKTPLAVIAGYANLLRRWGKDDPKILDEAVEAISRESENMKRIVDQLLWLAKIGNFSLNNSIFNLYETVDDIVAGYRLTNIKHKITLSGDASVTLNTDKNLMTEAVRTLVDNAIKYTPPDGGEIDITIASAEGGMELKIADNGIGISEADQAHIFERFYRCDKVRGRESGSSGLGLTICKSIVEMMGGSIAVQSELGKGSCFTITLH